MRVFVTGAAGNLGGKLVDHLMSSSWCEGVVAVDNRAASKTASSRLDSVVADLADPHDARWRIGLKSSPLRT